MTDLEQSYLDKAEHLSTYLEEVTPYEFYRDLFPVGSFERKGEYSENKPNGLALGIALGLDNENHAHHYTITDSLLELAELNDYDFAIMSPVSYFGKRRTGSNARYLYAMTFDLDGVGMQQLKDVLFQMKNGALPSATYIVSSGTGLHIYYFLKEPIPLYPKNQAYLKELKYALTRQIWNRYTSTLKEPQIQGIMQGYRIVGTQSKLGKDYPVRAYMYGRGERVDIQTLFEAVPSTSGEREIILKAKSSSGLTLEQAKEKYPQWYEERIVQQLPKKRWHIKRDLYDWWLNRISTEIKVGHRYYGIMTLAIYAVKCDIPIEELQADAFSLLSDYDEMSDTDLNRFTREDIMAALELYNDSYCTFPRDDIAKLTSLTITPNKRNGRKQFQHMEVMRAIQNVVNPNWREGNGDQKEVNVFKKSF